PSSDATFEPPFLLAPLHSAKGYPERLQQRSSFIVRLRGRADVDRQTLDLFHFVDVDLGEDDLLANAERVVPAPVEGLVRDALEVANARQRDVHQSIQEFVHPVTPQGNHAADRQTLAELEVRDRLLRLRHDRPLTSDRGELGDGRIEDFGILNGLAQAHVEYDL